MNTPAQENRANRPARPARQTLRWLWVALGLTVAVARAEPTPGPLPLKPRVLNVYRAAPVLPADLRRVAVLPLKPRVSDLEPEIRHRLEQALLLELGRSGLAEVLPVERGQLQKWTGRASWSPDEPLPPDLFEKLRRATEADAILFVELTAFRAYRPASVGWRLRLVDSRSGCTWWAADEIFNADDPAVVRAARQFERGCRWFADPHRDGWRTLQAPRELARLTVAWLLTTLPARSTFD